jgi:hypothetical protein
MENATTLQHPSTSTHWPTVLVLLLWFGLIMVMSMNGTFVSEPGQTPVNILLSFVISLGMFTLCYRSFAGFRQYVLGLDMRFLILLHSWRMLGLGFVMLHMQDGLPALFAYVAGFGDALTAIVATILAYTLFIRPASVSTKTLWRWNAFGLLDFVLAILIGILTRTGAPLVLENGISSDLMTVFPFAMIPGFLVQVFTLTHIIIFLQLRKGQS